MPVCLGLERTLPRLNGMFAFGALDVIAGRLYLVRDPFGVKPLYYSLADDGGFAFSSEVKALLPLANQAPRLASAGLAGISDPQVRSLAEHLARGNQAAAAGARPREGAGDGAA